MEWAIGFIPDANIILDPFAGSGTTGVAAIRTGRRCILIEKELKYCKIGAKRLAEACCEGEGQFRFPEADLFSSVETQT
jgi:site-specific DNA-methyltransferase (adenine-specific)/modification methylase